MVAGVLTILAAMSAGFYTLTISQSKSASRYTESVRAALLAHAGLADSVARLREQALVKTEDPTDSWYGVDWRNGATRRISYAERDFSKANQYKSYTRAIGSSLESNSDRYVMNIVDASSKINVNAGDNLGVLLDNLCRVIGPPLVAADMEMIQPARWDLEGAVGYGKNKDDSPANKDIYYGTDSLGRPLKLRPGGAAQFLSLIHI